MSSIRDLLHPTDESPFSSPASTTISDLRPNPLPTATSYLTIEYVLDTICPHCYIGLRNLESAIAIYKTRHRNVEFEVVCTPFVLDPPLYKPAYEKACIPFRWYDGTSTSRASHMLLRLALEATPSYTRSTAFINHPSRPSNHALKLRPEYLAHLKTLSPAQIAANASPDRSSVVSNPNTTGTGATSQARSSIKDVDLRELVSASPYVIPSPVVVPQQRGPKLQLSLALALCRGFFEHNINIYDQRTLIDIAKRVLGLPESEIRACLESEDWARLIEVLSLEARARIDAPGFTASAPAMIFQNQFLHPGWTQVDTLLDIFDDIREGRSPKRPTPSTPQ